MTTASLPRVPEGLRDLMKVYTKEVLREKPSDLYEFSAKFFNMIVGEKSHQAVRKYEPAQTYETIMKNRIRQQVPISMVFNIIPENLTDLIKQFIKAVLREKPENIYIFAQEYFQRLSKEKSGRTEYTKYATYEKSLKDKENVALVAKVTCECGRVLSAKTQNVENNTVLIEKEEKIDSNIPKKDDEEKNLISITYIKSVVIIQRNFRRYLKRVKTGPNKKDKCSSMEYMTSILLLQRQFRRLIAKKRVEKLKLSRTNQPKAKIDTANYMNAVLIIQRHYRIYLKKKQEQNRLKNEKVSLATAAIIIQRAFRRMLAVHKARRITSASADHPEDLNDNASETGSYTSVSTALLSTESTELGGTNYEERVHQKIIHEDEEVENSNVDGGLGKEYFEEPIKGAEKSILLRKSDTLSGPLIENPEDHESNDYSEFEVEKAKEELEDEFRAIKKRDAQNPSELELKLEKQDELQTQNLDAKETEKALDSKKENDTHLESEIEANLKSQKSIENLETENEDETRNIETIKGLEPIIKSEIEPKNTSEEPAETKNDTLQESESQNGKKEEEEKERSNKIFVDTPEDLEKKDNIEIIETIPPPKLVKAESQLQATPTISIEHVDDSPEENPQIQSESNDIVPESSEPSIISAVDQPESLSEIEVENLKSIQDTDKEGRDQESRKQSSIDNEKEKPVKSLVSNTSQEEKNKEYRKQTSIDKDKHNPVESLLSNANQEGHVQESTKQSSIDNDKEKLVESLDSNERQEGHKQESPKQPSLDNEKEKPLESSILNPIQGVASNEDNSSRDENDIETGLIHRAKRSLEELESNLDKIKENSESIAEENNVENLVEKEGNLKNSIERIDQNKSQEKNSDAPECKKEMETQDSPEMVANIGEDSLEKEIKPLTLEDVVGEVERLGDEIKNDTAETISNIKNAVSESIDAVEVSKENLLNKQYNEKLFEFQNNKKESTTDPKDENVDQEEPLSRSKRSTDKSNEQSNEELNEFQNNDIESRTDPKDEKVDQEGPLLRSKRSTEESNEQSNEEINKIQHNEKETTTDPKDEKVDQEGPLIRSKRSTEETEINLDSETDNSKNLTGEIPKESLTEGGEKKLMEETTMLHHTKLPLAEESFHEKNTTKDSLVNESVISTEAESCEPGQKNVLTKSLEIDPCKESGDDLEASKDNEKQTLVKEHASTDGTKLFVPSVESPSEKELPTSVDKLVESITYDELKSANDISLKDNKTGTKELLEKKNIDACKMKRQEISIQVDNGNSIQIDPTDATDTIKNAKESNSASMEKHSANETTDSFNNAKEEKEFHSADKESDKEVVAIEKIPSEDSKTSPAETTDKNAVSKESNSEKNSGDSSSALENKPNDAELDNAVTVNKDDETILKSSSKESIDKTPTESDLEKDQGKELSDENDLLIKTEEVKNLEKELSYENDLLIKTEEVKNLDEVEIKETQAPDSDSPVSKEIDVPDSKAEKPIDSIPSKTEQKNSSLLVTNQLIGTQNLPTNHIEIEKNTKKYSSVNVKDKDIGTLSSGRLVPTPIAELQLKSFKNTNDDGAWYDIYVENPIPLDTSSGVPTEPVKSLKTDSDQPTEIFEEPIIPQERVPSYYTPQKIIEPDVPKVKNSVSFFVSFDSDDGKPKYQIPKRFQDQSKKNITENKQPDADSNLTKSEEVETFSSDDNENEEEIEVIEVSEGDPEYQKMAGTKLQTILELNENEQINDEQNKNNPAVDPETGELSAVVKSNLGISKERDLKEKSEESTKSDSDLESLYKADILSLTKSVQIIERAYKRFKNKSAEVTEKQNIKIDNRKDFTEQQNIKIDKSNDVTEGQNNEIDNSEDVTEEQNIVIGNSQDVPEKQNIKIVNSKDVTEKENIKICNSKDVTEEQNNEIDNSKVNNAAKIIQKWIRNILEKNLKKLSSDNVKDSQQILAARKIQRAYRNYVKKLQNANEEISNEESIKIENNDFQEVENKEKNNQYNEKQKNAILIIQKAFRLYSQRNKVKQNKLELDENDLRQNEAAIKIQRAFKRYLKLIQKPDIVMQNESKEIEEVQESVKSDSVTTQEQKSKPTDTRKGDLEVKAKAVIIIQKAFRQYLERKKLEHLEENSFDSQSITSSRITTIENANYAADATPTDSLIQDSVENTPEIKPKSEWFVGSTLIIPSQEVVEEPLKIESGPDTAASARKSTQVVESVETVDSSHGSLESKQNSGTKFDETVGKDIEKDNALSCGLAGPEDAEVKAETGSDEDAILLTQSNLDKIEQDILSTQELVNNFLEKEIEFSSAQGPYESENLKEVVEEPCIKKSASLVNLSEEETGDPTDSSLSETTGLDTLSADTIDKATVKLAKPEEVIEKMSQLRESKSQSSQERIQSGDASFEEPIVRPMSSLQEQTSMDIEDGDIIVYNRLQRDETRESSAQSDSVVFGDPETEKIPEKDEESGRVHLMRHYTIAGDDPRGLFRSVTIDDALNYEEDMDSGHGIQNAASFYLDDETSENIRKKMMAYSLSETDSDYIDPRKVSQEDFDIDTAMADAMGTSTETESTIVSAATKIQAGARGFLTRRRLRRASAGTKSSTQDTKASFGNDAISESLERFIEEEAAKKIQAAYRIHTRKRKGYPRKMEGISLESNLAARRQKLQRGDALRNDSTPDDEHSVATNGGQTQKAAKPPRHKLVGDAKSRAAMELKWLTMRQNSMPVQIDCEVFRVIPKHMRKRIKSADANKRK
ncbi:MATH and LRR domain-containing protein PFE0570w isoform X3 [Drosophila ananassae]|uniref:MATH and LRR domain-containing protein PFE0570w isoform X3 n=1 Tax=Drosophila ananassae TaxID=7217 RepID=UPI001CFFBEE1|nr:MATH and LRR domain-containing protein PFE0570w isoform X3 [Drosophila ananassae]